jgi:multicomponent Na+:H+ antiporter subunit F
MDRFLLVIIGMLALSILLCAVRLLRGPTLANRVVALDLITVLAAALAAVFAIRFDQQVFLDMTIVVALVSFVGTVAFAYYLERRASR